MKAIIIFAFVLCALVGCTPCAQDPKDVAQKFIDVFMAGKLDAKFVDKYFVPGMPKDWCDSANAGIKKELEERKKEFDKKKITDRTSHWVHEATFISAEDQDLILLQIKEYIGSKGGFTGSMYISLRKVKGRWLIQNPFEHNAYLYSEKSKWKKTWSVDRSN